MKISVPAEVESLTGAVIGAAFEVLNSLGHGFLEIIYRKALVYELGVRGVAVGEEVPFEVKYKNVTLGKYYCDLLVENTVVVELKAIERLNPSHTGQVLNYLKAGGLKVGLLLNFGTPRLEYKRVIL
ncbi:MAG: GxxExxY protein [Syntrophobacteraceae bacterium]|nr:GxxExxY protein [Syntrophobacteraceae bacterium]